MDKKLIIWFLLVTVIVTILVSLDDKNKIETKKINLTVLSNKDSIITLIDDNNNIYKYENLDVKVGDIVYFAKYSIDELEVDEDWKKETYLVMKQSYIMAKEG